MIKRVKFPVSSLRGLIAGGLLAGAVGLGMTQAADYGTPSDKPSGTPTEDQSGVGGSQGPGMTGAAALPPNVAPGWKIRVCSEKTKAQSINFRISSADQKGQKSGRAKTTEEGAGMGGSGEQAAGQDQPQTGATGDQAATPGQGQETASWTQGESSLITVPESFSMMERIKIEAIPAQKDMNSEVCVLFNDHVAKKISFDDRKETTVKMNDNATCGC